MDFPDTITVLIPGPLLPRMADCGMTPTCFGDVIVGRMLIGVEGRRRLGVGLDLGLDSGLLRVLADYETDLVWQQCLNELKLCVTKSTFDTWLKDTYIIEPLEANDSIITIGCRTPYAREWLDNRLRSTIERVLTTILGHSVHIHFQTHPQHPSFLPQ